MLHQYELLAKGSSIHAPCQFEWYKNYVNDKSILLPGGLQRILTLEGYIIPLSINDGLARLDIRPYTDSEFDTLPQVFLTSEVEWDPSILDHDAEEQWEDTQGNDLSPNLLFDEYGNYRKRISVQHMSYFQRHNGNTLEDIIDQCVYHSQAHHWDYETSVFYDAYEHELDTPIIQEIDHNDNTLEIIPKTTTKKSPNYELLHPFFVWFSTDIISKTFEHTTQYARLPTGTMMKRSFKTSNPALNVSRRNEPICM